MKRIILVAIVPAFGALVVVGLHQLRNLTPFDGIDIKPASSQPSQSVPPEVAAIANETIVLTTRPTARFSIDQPSTSVAPSDSDGVIYVGGTVKQPGTYPIRGMKMTLLSFIKVAGGEDSSSNYQAIVKRTIKKPLIEYINFTSLKALEQNPQADEPVKAGDMIVVKAQAAAQPTTNVSADSKPKYPKASPSRETIYIGGPLKKSGVFSYDKDRKILGYIDLADGLENPDSDWEVDVIHRIDDQLIRRITFSSLRAFEANPSADMKLEEGDIISIHRPPHPGEIR